MTDPLTLKFIECPRDAMQGWPHLIPTQKKIAYLQQLMQVGFDTIDAGSFVSAKAIPQMADTAEVFASLDRANSASKLLVIVANLRGAEQAMQFKAVDYLGFPFSLSETFQQRNTHSSVAESFDRVSQIQELCVRHHKQMVIYLSMGFGNPYGDPYNADLVISWAERLAGLGIKIISLADTVGIASAELVSSVTAELITALPSIEIGVHLHSSALNWEDKLNAAYMAGCMRFDGALKGIGGCPMAGDVLVGNMNTEWMIGFFQDRGLMPPIDSDALQRSLSMAAELFS